MTRKKKVTDLESLDSLSLLRKANSGDPESTDILRKRHRENPAFLLQFGDLAESARNVRLEQMLGDKGYGYKLAFKKKMNHTIKMVAGEGATPIERLLAERIVMCWLDVCDQETRYAMLRDARPKEYEYRSRMLDRAHNRYLSAIKALAHVRRLGLPVVQVNIGDQQVNVAGTVQTPPIKKGLPPI